MGAPESEATEAAWHRHTHPYSPTTIIYICYSTYAHSFTCKQPFEINIINKEKWGKFSAHLTKEQSFPSRIKGTEKNRLQFMAVAPHEPVFPNITSINSRYNIKPSACRYQGVTESRHLLDLREDKAVLWLCRPRLPGPRRPSPTGLRARASASLGAPGLRRPPRPGCDTPQCSRWRGMRRRPQQSLCFNVYNWPESLITSKFFKI